MTHRTNRPGIILLVVLAMLTLFAVIGLTFVYYSKGRSEAARIFRESQNVPPIPVPQDDPQLLLDEFLRQAIYDVPDTSPGVYSALRGHSLARSMYGYNSSGTNDVPYNGTGRLRIANAFGTSDEYDLINYTYYPVDGKLHDPERITWRTDPGQALGTYCGGFNPPYTYPDVNNMYLAAVKADGTVLTPSYHRPWLDAEITSTSAEGKYKILRPRSGAGTENPAFPGISGKGDVQNLVGGPSGNDSVWIDIGEPVRTLSDGRRYKPLYAPLIVDLDNLVNVNVHGNVRGASSEHFSNQGWGPWEVSVKQVLDPTAADWKNLFIGNGSNAGRYGTGAGALPMGGTQSTPNIQMPLSFKPMFHSKVDYDGVNGGQGGAASGKVYLPGDGGWITRWQCFPSYEGNAGAPANQGYENSNAAECLNHPALFSVVQPFGDDKVFAHSNMKALWYGGSGTSAEVGNSELGKLCPTKLNDGTAASFKRRHLITTLSYDVDKPGLAPWIWNTTSVPYALTAGTFPTGGQIAFPGPLGTPPPGALGSSEFTGDWKSAIAALGRIDLNAPLPSYPTPDGTGQVPAGSVAQFDLAQLARKQRAQQIYDRLRYVTGAADPATAVLTSNEYRALRWLAQLAVNIVDYIDPDEYNTPFQWNTRAYATVQENLQRNWVFGVEMPRVLVNEVYCQVDNDPAEPVALPATLPYHVNFWVELHNPHFADATTPDPIEGTSVARLRLPSGSPVHRIVIANNATFTDTDVLGQPTSANTLSICDFKPHAGFTPAVGVNPDIIHPTDGGYDNNGGASIVEATNVRGFYVAGPKYVAGASIYDFPSGTKPTLRADTDLTVTPKKGLTVTAATNTIGGLGTPPRYMVILQRLLCPHRPAQDTDPTASDYNPFVTIDMMQTVTWGTNIGVTQHSSGANTPTALTARNSLVRLQPLAGLRTPHTVASTSTTSNPKHAFFRHNGLNATPPAGATGDANLTLPCEWLVHLNRNLVSPGELLTVSACKPHELTQRFKDSTNAYYKHQAEWFNPNTRLYRFFELITTKNRMSGMPEAGGRVPGKININTVWDLETMYALGDAQTPNYYVNGDVLGIAAQLVLPRTPLYGSNLISPSDKPLWGVGAPNTAGAAGTQYPTDIGIEKTIFKAFDPAVPNGRRLFQLPDSTDNRRHPHIKNQLLTKILNNMTTRSNTFAVLLTVGFFEVPASSTSPPYQLGAEINRDINQQIRHRMFALIDRTAISKPSGYSTTSPTGIPNFGLQTITPALMAENVATPAWTIQAGSILTLEAGTSNEETLSVVSIEYDTPTLNGAVSAGIGQTINLNGPGSSSLRVGASVVLEPGTASQETVIVKTIASATQFTADVNTAHPSGSVWVPRAFKANLNKAHPTAGFPINIAQLGNPGPKPSFRAIDNGAVVPYAVVIE